MGKIEFLGCEGLFPQPTVRDTQPPTGGRALLAGKEDR